MKNTGTLTFRILISILFLNIQAFAQGEFITLWNLSITGSGSNSLTFGVSTSGISMYTAETMPSGPTSSGTFSGTSLSITGLATNGLIRLKISPTNFERIIINNGTDRNRLVDILQWGTTQWTSMENAFRGCSSLAGLGASDTPDLSRVLTIQNMFFDAINFNHPIGNWNMSTITNTGQMFFRARAFNQPIGNWNVSNVLNMEQMFGGASSFNQPIGNWDVSKVTSMNAMFSFATAFNQPIGNWNVSNVKNMSGIFQGASNFNQPIGNWNVGNVTQFVGMFSLANSFNQPLDNWNISNAVSFWRLFSGATAFNQPLNNWNTGNVTDMSYMFENATSFNQPLDRWNTSKVTNMNRMFIRASTFNQPLNDWNTSNVSDFTSMFESASSFNQPLDKWDIGSNRFFTGMFGNATTFNQNLSAWAPKFPANSSLNLFLNGSGMSSLNYDALLIALNKTNLTSITFGAQGLTFCAAVAARNSLTATGVGNKNWVITDGGLNSTGGGATIVLQPVSQTICGGNLYTFTSSATGTKLSYEWSDASNKVVGYGRIFTTGKSGNYKVTVSSDGCTPSVSSVAELKTDVQIVSQSNSVFRGTASSYTFAVSATGQNLSYAWSNGQSSSNQMTTSVPGIYLVTVTGLCGRAISEPFYLNAEFVTLWDLSVGGVNTPNDRIRFVTENTGPVAYSWETFPVATLSGSGVFQGNAGNVYDLPIKGQIRLKMSPINLRRFTINNSLSSPLLIDIPQWGTTPWTTMESAFSPCVNLAGQGAIDAPDLRNVTNLSSMFSFDYSFNHPIGHWNTENVTVMGGMFSNAQAFNQPIGNWDVSKVVSMSSMFLGASSFNQPLNNWDVSNVTDMNNMFNSALVFNQPLSSWNVSKVKFLTAMFYKSNFNQPIGNWNVGETISLQLMFGLNPVFNQPIGNWNVSNVINMSGMFSGATSFNQPIGNWNVSKVITFLTMFATATGFNQPLNQWNISTASNLINMFLLSSSFNQNLGSWGRKLNPSANLSGMLNNAGLNTRNYDVLLQGFNEGTVTGRNLGAVGLQYCGANVRANLTTSGVGNKNWTITGDAFGSGSIGATIATQPVGITQCSTPHTLAVSATGSNLSYVWTDNSNTIVSENQNFATSVSGIYTVSVFGNGCMTAASNPVQVNLLPQTIITAQPLANATVCSGVAQSYTVSATGDNLSYRWNSGEATPFVLTSTAGVYTVTVSGTCGLVTSSPAVLTVQNCSVLNTGSGTYTPGLFAIYPNPAATSFTIESNVIGQFIITDVLGNIVLQGELKPGANPSLSLPAKGMYMVHVGNSTKKLVLE